MKIIKGNFEILPLRQEIPIEELKRKKKILDTGVLAGDVITLTIEKYARLIDTAILNHARYKQEHNLACDLAKALLKVLAVSEDEELQENYRKLLERAKRYKCFEFTEEDYNELGIEQDKITLIYQLNE